MEQQALPIEQGLDLLRTLLNKRLTIKLTDDRTLVGVFLCVDRDANIIIGSASEYSDDQLNGEARVLGLAMVPGRHVVSIQCEKENLPSYS
jgi:small nuclear ribonucleoprotein (snRNP)-like protein